MQRARNHRTDAATGTGDQRDGSVMAWLHA
jgi:hypothetical protein